MPMGMSSTLCTILAKNQAVALNRGAVSGDDTCHLPLQLSTGFVCPFWGIGAMRTQVFSEAVAISSLAFFTGQFQKPSKGISMFDCPDANHTSPMSTRLSVSCC